MSAGPAEASEVRATSGALVRRRSRVAQGLGLLALAAVVVAFFTPAMPEISRRVDTLDQGTIIYQRAQWASTVALASWLAAALTLAAWLTGASMRLLIGLAPRPKPRWVALFNMVRGLVFVVGGFWLVVWAAEEMILRKDPLAPQKALALGLSICLLLAYDIPRLVGRGLSLLRARLPLLRVPLTRLDEIKSEGRVQIRGEVVEILGEGQAPPPLAAYYRHDTGGEHGVELAVHVEAAPFVLQDGSARAVVSASPEELVVQDVDLDMAPGPRNVVQVTAGDTVHVIGDARLSGGGPYRQGTVSIEPRSGPIYLFGAAGPMSRRLILAALVELASAATLAACLVGLVLAYFLTGAAVPGQ